MKNIVAFFEIPATDFKRAVKFYETVLDLKLEVAECGENEKMAFFPRCEGAVSWTPNFRPSENGTLISLNVESIEAVESIIAKLGGRITRPKTKIEVDGMGFFATFIDSEGNRVGLYSDN